MVQQCPMQRGKNFNVVFLPLRYSAGDTYRGSGLVAVKMSSHQTSSNKPRSSKCRHFLCHQHLCCVAYRDCFVISFCGVGICRHHTLKLLITSNTITDRVISSKFWTPMVLWIGPLRLVKNLKLYQFRKIFSIA